jgi:hypothetical protein
MKTAFGTPLSRLLRGGVLLSPIESWATQTLVSSLPQELRLIIEAQFERYVLVQREFDGRALNFYPRRRELRAGLRAPSLQMDLEDAPLVRIRMSVSEPHATLHAVLSAVLGRAFSVSFSQDVRPFAASSCFEVEEVVQSWRSNFSLAEAQQAIARDVRNARA